MSWFKRQKTPLHTTTEEDRRVKTEGLFTKCDGCKSIIWKKDLEASLFVCQKCSYHFRINAEQRLRFLYDNGDYKEYDLGLKSSDPLKFVDKKNYEQRLRAAEKVTGCNEAVRTAVGKLNGVSLLCAAMEYRFIGGSMGSVVGEKITRTIERALETETPLIIISASGGARMMESFLSLMQIKF